MKETVHLFDLGKVIVDINFEKCLEIWSFYINKPPSYIIKNYRFDEHYDAHERGELTINEYKDAVNSRLKIDLTLNQFLHGWNSIFQGLFINIEKAIKFLSRTSPVYALTNTNEEHRQVWGKLYPHLFDLFENIYISNEIGLRKPERECYQYVLNDLSLETNQIKFYDDNIENITSAKTFGFDTFHVTEISLLEKEIINHIP